LYASGIIPLVVIMAMAYLVFTPDARFFTPMHAGLTEARAEQLRAALRAYLGDCEAVRTSRPGKREEGGDAVTVVWLR
jgi:hypothetical protein